MRMMPNNLDHDHRSFFLVEPSLYEPNEVSFAHTQVFLSHLARSTLDLPMVLLACAGFGEVLYCLGVEKNSSTLSNVGSLVALFSFVSGVLLDVIRAVRFPRSLEERIAAERFFSVIFIMFYGFISIINAVRDELNFLPRLNSHDTPPQWNQFNAPAFLEPGSLETGSWRFYSGSWDSLDDDWYQYTNQNREMSFVNIEIHRHAEDHYEIKVECNRDRVDACEKLVQCFSHLAKEKQMHFANNCLGQFPSRHTRQLKMQGSQEVLSILLRDIIKLINRFDRSIDKKLAQKMLNHMGVPLRETYDATQNQQKLELLQSIVLNLEVVPGDFICPLTLLLMVKPMSYEEKDVKWSFERSYISRVLLNKKQNPLTRTPLSFPMLFEDKQKEQAINQFLYQPELRDKVATRFLFNSLSTTLNDAQHVRDVCPAPYFFKAPIVDSDNSNMPSKPSVKNGGSSTEPLIKNYKSC